MEDGNNDRPLKKPLKILVVDEDWQHLEELMMILQMEKFDVFPHTSPTKAIENFPNIHPDVVIMELKEPKEKFFDFIKWLRSHKNFNQRQVILYTSDTLIDQQDLHEMKIGYLFKKPFKVEELIQAIRGEQ